jgi:hypothetical protein
VNDRGKSDSGDTPMGKLPFTFSTEELNIVDKKHSRKKRGRRTEKGEAIPPFFAVPVTTREVEP